MAVIINFLKHFFFFEIYGKKWENSKENSNKTFLQNLTEKSNELLLNN
jgi:hypothetical protein